jgi:hypothetical protein
MLGSSPEVGFASGVSACSPVLFSSWRGVLCSLMCFTLGESGEGLEESHALGQKGLSGPDLPYMRL